MGHFEIENETPFAFAPLVLADEEGRPLLVSVTKATYDIVEGGSLALAVEQVPSDHAGTHHGEPGKSSLRCEPETAFTKLATDVVFVAHAHSGERPATVVDVSLRVGPLEKRLRITGDRVWVRRAGLVSASEPKPFTRMPIVYERAFGGWDRSPEDPSHHTLHAENPVGVGYRGKRARFEEGTPLPNVEDPEAPLTRFGGAGRHAGCGFVSPDWEPRRSLAGTYDAAWARDRMPLLPRDFDRRFFNAASPGLVAPGYLRGDEPVVARGVSQKPSAAFRLPGLAPPLCRVALRDRDTESARSNLDTVVIDFEAQKVFLTWRCVTLLRGGAMDVRRIRVTSENAPERRGEASPDNVVHFSRPSAA